jgi:hypothetical protein
LGNPSSEQSIGAPDLTRQSDYEFSTIADPWPKPAVIGAWILVMAGALVRLLPYLGNRSLWLDEAALSLNIAERSYAALLKPLHYGQSAPVGFLWLEKTATAMLGNNEFGLRLVPLLGGLLSLVLFYGLTRRFLKPIAGLIALAMFAFSGTLVYYASEVKPYSTDVTATIAILLSGLMFMRGRGGVAASVGLGATGALSILISFPSVFVLAGFATIWFFFDWLSGRRRSAITLSILTLCWFAVFLPTFLIRATPNPGLYNFWREGFMPPGLFPIKSILWLGRAPFAAMKSESLGLTPFWLATASFCLGCLRLWQSERWRLALLLSPMAVALAAALLHLYPMLGGRLTLFLVPLYLIVIATGLDFVWRSRIRAISLLAPVVAVVLLFSPLRGAVASVGHLAGHEEIKAVLDYVLEHGQQGDIVYVYSMSQDAFDFYNRYNPAYQMSGMVIVKGRPRTADFSQYEADLQKLRGFSRVWIVISHFRHPDAKGHDVDEDAAFRAILDRMGTRRSAISVEGASGYLYDLSS